MSKRGADFLEAVGYQDSGEFGSGVELVDEAHELMAGGGIKAVVVFVEDEDSELFDEGAGDEGFAELSGGQGGEGFVEEVGKVEVLGYFF